MIRVGRSRPPRVRPREIEVGARFGLDATGVVSGEPGLVQAQGQHLAANKGAVAAVKVEQAQDLGVAAGANVFVHERPPESGKAAVRQVHGQERHFGSHVGAPITRCELDAIEQVQASTLDTDARSMQVAVSVTNTAARHAALEQVGVLVQEVRRRSDAESQ